MKKTIATLVLATVLVGTGGTMALADESGPDTPISTDATENGIVSEDGSRGLSMKAAPELVPDRGAVEVCSILR